jgi:ABC-type methionine transport system permease subunit
VEFKLQCTLRLDTWQSEGWYITMALVVELEEQFPFQVFMDALGIIFPQCRTIVQFALSIKAALLCLLQFA